MAARLLIAWLVLASGASQVKADTAVGPAHDPGDRRMLSIDGSPVYWPELRFWILYIGRYYEKSRGIDHISDWTTEQNGVPLRDFLLSTAVDYARKDRAIELKAAELGVALSDADRQSIEDTRRRNLKIYGSQSEYQHIVESMYGSEALFDYLTTMDLVGNALFSRLYGADGEHCDDTCVASYVQQQHLIAARFIFRSNRDAQGQLLSAELRRRNHTLLQRLRGELQSSRTPAMLFQQFVAQYGQDTALSNETDGELFAPSSKDSAFAQACLALPANHISGVVATAQGEYLILRLPVSSQMQMNDTGHSLRYWVAYESQFKPQVAAWTRTQQIVYDAAYAQIDLPALFPSN